MERKTLEQFMDEVACRRFNKIKQRYYSSFDEVRMSKDQALYMLKCEALELFHAQEMKFMQGEISNSFTKGFTCACAILQSLEVGHNKDMSGSYAEEVLVCSDHTIEKLKACNVEESDITLLMPVLKELQRKSLLNT